jgi:hypothetical protein
MSRIDEILAKQQALEKELEVAMKEERANVLKDIKAKIKMFDFKATDFKGLLKSRVTQKQVEDYLQKKEDDKNKKPKAKKTVAKK